MAEIHEDHDGPVLFGPYEVAKIFFNRSPHWLRWRERKGQLAWQGEPIGHRSEKGERQYTLYDVLLLARASEADGLVSPGHLASLERAIQALREVHREVPVEGEWRTAKDIEREIEHRDRLLAEVDRLEEKAARERERAKKLAADAETRRGVRAQNLRDRQARAEARATQLEAEAAALRQEARGDSEMREDA